MRALERRAERKATLHSGDHRSGRTNAIANTLTTQTMRMRFWEAAAARIRCQQVLTPRQPCGYAMSRASFLSHPLSGGCIATMLGADRNQGAPCASPN